MPASETRIDTDRPSRYLIQFCRHANAIGSVEPPRLPVHGDGTEALQRVTVRAEWSDTEGTVSLDPWGDCRLEATETGLSIRLEACDDDTLRRIEDIVANDIHRFSGGSLKPTWQRCDPPTGGPV